MRALPRCKSQYRIGVFAGPAVSLTRADDLASVSRESAGGDARSKIPSRTEHPLFVDAFHLSTNRFEFHTSRQKEEKSRRIERALYMHRNHIRAT